MRRDFGKPSISFAVGFSYRHLGKRAVNNKSENVADWDCD
jgi:hypothetical protein